jgi:hypothetical protein
MREAPWDARALELEAKEGDWCRYAAWLEWFEAKADDGAAILEALEPVQRTELFCVMEDLFPPAESPTP